MADAKPNVSGHWRRLSLPRRGIVDLMRISRGMPMITFERRMNLAPLVAARQSQRISWTLLFAKAFAIVAQNRPELRRAYMGYPWPHLFEADGSIATVALERDYEGEPAVFFAAIHEPATQSLQQLQDHLIHWQTAPLASVSRFRRLLRYSRLPWPLRRLVWWYGFNVSGCVRAYNFGTFGLSTTAASGATALNLISPVTSTLNYGPFDAEHRLDVRLHFDHRVYDGMTAARVLAEMENVLNGDIANELINDQKQF